jgi:hypothetical protein
LAAATAALKDLAPLANADLTALFQAEGLRETARAIVIIFVYKNQIFKHPEFYLRNSWISIYLNNYFIANSTSKKVSYTLFPH